MRKFCIACKDWLYLEGFSHPNLSFFSLFYSVNITVTTWNKLLKAGGKIFMSISFLFPPNLCPDNFFKRKTSLNLLQYCFCLVFWFFGLEAHVISAPHGTCTPCIGRWSLTPGHPRKCLYSCHFIQSYLIIWPSFDFSLHNLLTHSLKTLWNLSYLEHVLLCANSKRVFQASTVTLCDRQDLVSF